MQKYKMRDEQKGAIFLVIIFLIIIAVSIIFALSLRHDNVEEQLDKDLILRTLLSSKITMKQFFPICWYIIRYLKRRQSSIFPEIPVRFLIHWEELIELTMFTKKKEYPLM